MTQLRNAAITQFPYIVIYDDRLLYYNNAW